jgi:hypothetical protein
MVTPVLTVFVQGLSRSAAAATELLGNAFPGIVVSDRFSAYNNLPVEQRQLCWAHLIRDLTSIAQRSGASAEFGTVLPPASGKKSSRSDPSTRGPNRGP